MSKKNYTNILVLEEDIPIVHEFIEDNIEILDNDNIIFFIAQAIKTLTEDQLKYLLHMLDASNIKIPDREDVAKQMIKDGFAGAIWVDQYLDLL